MPDAWTKPDEALVELAKTLTLGRALDVGCGGGHDSLWLAQQGWSVTAIDTSRHAVAKLRALARESQLDVTAVKQDVTTLETTDEFGLVSICYMHLPASDRVKMLASAGRALKPGGTLIFRSFESGIAEAPFDRSLLPSRDDVLAELGERLMVKRANVADEFFAYMKKMMRLLTVIALRPE